MRPENDEAGKIFVGGLNLQTTEETLETHFRQYGEIVSSVVMKHKETGKSKGFGFITFKDTAIVSSVLEAGPHVLDGKAIDPKTCTKRKERKEGGGVNSDSLKAFLGGLPLDTTEDDLMQAFKKFGEVKDIVIMYDQEKKKPRGFGFLTFDSQDALQRACSEHFIVINGKQVECKGAQPRIARSRQPYGRPPQGGGMPQRGGANWQHSGGQPQSGGYRGSDSAPGGYGGNNLVPGGYRGRNSAPSGYGGGNFAPGGYGGNNSTSGGYGGNNSTSGGYGGNNSTPGGYGGNNSTPGGYGGNNSTPGGYGGNNSTSGGYGGNNSTSGGYGGNNSTPGGNNFAPVGYGCGNSAPGSYGGNSAPGSYGGNSAPGSYGGNPALGGYGDNKSASTGGYSSGGNAYQQPSLYNYQQGNHGGGYQNYNSPQVGYAVEYPISSQPPSASQNENYGYGNDGGYDQGKSQYGPTKGRQSRDNGYESNEDYKSKAGRGKAYHPY